MIQRRRKRESFLPWLQLSMDLLSIYALLPFVFWVRFYSGYFDQDIPSYLVYQKSFHLVALVLVFFLRTYGLYRPANLLTFGEETGKVVKAVIVSTLVLMGITFFVRDFTFSRTFLVMAGATLAVGISLARFVLGTLVMLFDRKRGSYRNVMVIGCEENAKKLVRFYQKNPRFMTLIIGYLDDREEPGSTFEGLPVFGKISELPDILRSMRYIHEVVLAMPGASAEKVLKIVYECEKQMVSLRWVADIFGLIASKMKVSYLGDVSVLSFTDSPLSDWENRALKRTMDFLVSAAALVLFSPIFLLVALCIRWDSRGSIFYRQQRIGENGNRFILLKFRTMKNDAEKDTGPVWAVENDMRRTKIGAFLRRNNLDELPQLWNVLIGDMSLVGPRPERPFFVSQFREDIPRYMARHSIRSGITGWAQVNGLRGNTSVEERTKFDLYYIENWSLLFDFKILLMTIFARRNAY